MLAFNLHLFFSNLILNNIQNTSEDITELENRNTNVILASC